MKTLNNVTMASFTTRPDSFKELQRTIVRRVVPVNLALLLVFVVIDVFFRDTGDWVGTVIVVGLIHLLMMYFGFRHQRKTFESYKLTITNDRIMREQFSIPDLTISKTDVQQIVKGKDGSFAIISESKSNTILVPAQIDRPTELEQKLSEIGPIMTKDSTWPTYVQVPLLLVGMTILGCGLIFGNNYVYSLSALGMCSLLIYSFVLIQRNSNVDLILKRLSYAIFFPVLAILAVTVIKWMGSW